MGKERIWEQKREDWWPMLSSGHDLEIEWSSKGKVRARRKGDPNWKKSQRRVSKAEHAITEGERIIGIRK